MFFKPNVYCASSEKLGSLKSNGNCSNCGGTCRSYPEFMRSVSMSTKEIQRTIKRFPFDIHWVATRAETEWGIDIDTVINEAYERLSDPRTGYFLPSQLPKLDFIAVALVHTLSGEKIVIHDDHYDAKFYWHSSRHDPVNFSYATGSGLNDLVFKCDTENRETGLLFSDLQIYLHLLFAQNRLWYAMLAEGHYVIPDRPFGFEHLL